MKQLEIEFFYPLTEQIDLDLDFSPCEEYQRLKREEYAKTRITYTNSYIDYNVNAVTTNSYVINSSHGDTKGAIEITPDFHVYVKKEPSRLAKFAMKKVFGWNWKSK
jgi:hypothetical protein